MCLLYIYIQCCKSIKRSIDRCLVTPMIIDLDIADFCFRQIDYRPRTISICCKPVYIFTYSQFHEWTRSYICWSAEHEFSHLSITFCGALKSCPFSLAGDFLHRGSTLTDEKHVHRHALSEQLIEMENALLVKINI